MAEIYFAEEGFADWMRQETEPYLTAHCEDGYLRSADGASIHYRRYRLPGAEKCVVISHGFCEFAQKYNEFIYYLLLAGISVYILEHRGHGDSARRAADPEMVHIETYQEYVNDFVRFVETVVVSEKHRVLFAHSMGGAIGALVLEQYPHLFEAAVLSSPMCGMKTGRYPGWLARVMAWFNVILGRGMCYAPGQGGFREKPDFAGSSCLSKERYQYAFEKRMEYPKYRTYGGSYFWVYAGLKASKQLMKQRNLKKIQVPILLFEAGCDHMVENSTIERFARGTKHTTLIVMRDAKHEIFNAHLAVRREYYEKIIAFLQEI